MSVGNPVGPQWGYDQERDRYFRDKNGERDYYTQGNLIGSGAVGDVYLLIPIRKEKKTKVIKIRKNIHRDLLRQELDMSKKIPQGIGIQLPAKGYIPQSKNFTERLILPKYDGDLQKLCDSGEMSAELILEAMYQLLQGLVSLKNHALLHSDLRAKNIFYRFKENQIRFDICDFGQASVCSNEIELGADAIALRIDFTMMICGNACERRTVETGLKEKGLPAELVGLLRKMGNIFSVNAAEILDEFLRINPDFAKRHSTGPETGTKS